MDKTSRFMILLIPVLGLIAGGVAVWESIDPAIRGAVSGSIYQLFVLGFASVVAVFGVIKVPQAIRRSRSSGYRKPIIVGARAGDGLGEITVSAGHSSDVMRDMALPRGSKVTTLEQNSLNRVEFPSNGRAKVEAVARENGYQGRVG